MGAYAITKRLNTPLVLQPQLFGVLCLTSFAQCIYYGPRRAPTDAAHPMNLPPAVRRRRQFPCAAAYAAVLAVAGGAEVGLVFTIRPAWERGHQGPVVAVGALSSVLLAIALLYVVSLSASLRLSYRALQATVRRDLPRAACARNLAPVHGRRRCGRRVQRPQLRLR
jgi:hypothetical protein